MAPCAALATAGLLAACGSGSSGASGSSSPSKVSSASASSATVALASVSGYGSVLEYEGKPAYVLSTDPSGSSKCSGTCAGTWSPATASGDLSAGPGVTASLVSTFKRSDGTEQVLYNDHALYTHSGNAASVAGTASDGGVWYLINAKGSAVKSTTAGGY